MEIYTEQWKKSSIISNSIISNNFNINQEKKIVDSDMIYGYKFKSDEKGLLNELLNEYFNLDSNSNSINIDNRRFVFTDNPTKQNELSNNINDSNRSLLSFILIAN